MTVPRKVILLRSSQGAGTGNDHGGGVGVGLVGWGRNVNTLMIRLGLAHSRTCSRRTCIHPLPDPTPPSQLRSG